MQWLTPTIGRPSVQANALAAVAATRRHGPRPGPMENETRSMSEGSRPALSRAAAIVPAATSAWWLAASRGCSPPCGGRNMSISFARTLQSWSTIPTPSVCAVPSIPSVSIFTALPIPLILNECVWGRGPVPEQFINNTETFINKKSILGSLGSWSRGYDVALTWRRSPVRFRPGPLIF